MGFKEIIMNGITRSTNNLGLGLRRRITRTITSAGEYKNQFAAYNIPPDIQIQIGSAQNSGSNIARTLSTVAAGNAAEDINAQLNQMDAWHLLNI